MKIRNQKVEESKMHSNVRRFKHSGIVLALATALLYAGAARSAEIYVSTNGSDENGAGTVEAPYRTIQYAFSKADTNDEVRVAGGMYRESVTNLVGGSIAPSIHMSGSWLEDFSARDLENYRSTIKPPNALVGKVPCIYISNSTNIITGFTLTGGTDGLKRPDDGTMTDTKIYKGSPTYNHKLAYLIITNNTDGVDFGGCRVGCVITSSIIADNEVYGVAYSHDNCSHFFLQNCTIVRNKYGLWREHHYNAPVYTYNTIFAENDYAVYNAGSAHHGTRYEHTLFWDNGANIVQTVGFTSGLTYLSYDLVSIFSSDPLFDETFAPSKSSEMHNRGKDLSASARYPVTMDVYGRPFDGAYPIGAVICAGDEPVKAEAMYVNAETGDDSSDGLTPETAKKTINAAILHVAPSGTVYVADGIYKEQISLSVKGVKLIGESRDHTVLCHGDEIPPSDSDGVYRDFRWGIGVFADDVTVKNFTVRNTFSGFHMFSDTYCERLLIENCDIDNNVIGVYLKTDSKVSPIYIENTKIRNNERYGIIAYCALRMKNLLVADNGTVGIHNEVSSTINTHGANLTVVGNGSHGFYSNSSSPNDPVFFNSVFAGNGTSAIYVNHSTRPKEYRCCFYGNGANGTTHFGNKTPVLYSPIYDDPKLDATETLRGVLAEDSPLVQAGTNLYSSLLGVITNDINYVKRLVDKPDIGCYVSTATMREQVGEGSRLVTVTGAPNGYGFPSPMYGTHLAADGEFSFDVSGTLETDGVDAKRNHPLGVGLRARYDGYRVISEATGEVIAESESGESATLTATGNVNIEFKWTHQCRIIANAVDEGCLVRVNDNEAGLVVTNWVDTGSSVTVTYIYDDNYSLDHWIGDMPEGVSINEAVFSYTVDIPRAFEVVSRGVFYVSTLGDDEEGDGTKSKPWRTISKAVTSSSVVAGDTIKIQGGIYEESITNKTSLGGKGSLEFSGSWNSSWERDLVDSRTVIVPPEPFKMKVPCLFLEGVGYSRFSGIDFTGGSSAVYSKNSLGTNLSAASHDLYYQVVVSNNVKGINYGDSHLGAAIVSSLFVRNDTYGYRHYRDQGGNDYILNCTFADNGGWAIQREHGSVATMTIRNSIFERNGGVLYNTGTTRWAAFYDCCLGSVTNRHFGITTRTGSAFYSIAMRDTTRYEDDTIDASWRIRSTASHLKLGKNLVNNSIYQYSSDLYGTPFGEEWDYGCIKSDHPANARYSVQYVSESGDDANDGTTPEKARRTIAAAMNHIEENGTVYVGSGTYAPFMLGVEGVRVIGAGRTASVIAATSNETAATCARPLIDIFKPYTSVEKMSLEGGYAGIVNHSHDVAPYTSIKDIDVSDCVVGIYYPSGSNSSGHSDYYLTVERVKITNNSGVGFYMGNCVRLASSLIAHNGSSGITMTAGDQCGSLYVVNTTIMDNLKGVSCASGWTEPIYFRNCIIAGNATVGLERVDKNYSGGIYLYNCVVFNDVNYNKVNDSSLANNVAGAIYLKTAMCEEDPLLKPSGKIPMSSPAVGFGVDHTWPIKPLTYIDGKVIDYTKRVDAGCYSPDSGFMLIIK